MAIMSMIIHNNEVELTHVQLSRVSTNELVHFLPFGIDSERGHLA
jgi:hypothetical protein